MVGVAVKSPSPAPLHKQTDNHHIYCTWSWSHHTWSVSSLTTQTRAWSSILRAALFTDTGDTYCPRYQFTLHSGGATKNPATFHVDHILVRKLQCSTSFNNQRNVEQTWMSAEVGSTLLSQLSASAERREERFLVGQSIVSPK